MTKKSIKQELNKNLENLKKDLTVLYQLKKNIPLVSKYKRFNVKTIEMLTTNFEGEVRKVWKSGNKNRVEQFCPYNYITEASSYSYGEIECKKWKLNLDYHDFTFSISKTLVDWEGFEKELDEKIERFIVYINQTKNKLATIDWDIERFNKLALEFTKALETFRGTGLCTYANQITPRLRYECIEELNV